MKNAAIAAAVVVAGLAGTVAYVAYDQLKARTAQTSTPAPAPAAPVSQLVATLPQFQLADRAGEMRSLQDWQEAGGELGNDDIEQALRRRAAGFGSALRIRWRLPFGLRELIAAYYALGSGVFSREALVALLDQLGNRALDRIVPFGRALDFHPVWDGTDLLDVLTRKITLPGS